MKIRIITIFLLINSFVIVSSSLLHSQTLIPQAGITFSRSTLSSKDTHPHRTNADFRQGFLAGVGVEFSLADRVNLQSGLVYIQKGTNNQHKASTSDNLVAIHNFNFRLGYLDLPLLCRFSIIKKSDTELYLKGGATFSWWVNGQVDYFISYDNYNGVPPSQWSGEWKMKYDDSRFGDSGGYYYFTQRYDVGIYSGLGMLINKKIYVDIGYTMGLEDLEYFYGKVANNRMIQLYVGIPFKIRNNDD